jgi:hypothetical protein
MIIPTFMQLWTKAADPSSSSLLHFLAVPETSIISSGVFLPMCYVPAQQESVVVHTYELCDNQEPRLLASVVKFTCFELKVFLYFSYLLRY